MEMVGRQEGVEEKCFLRGNLLHLLVWKVASVPLSKQIMKLDDDQGVQSPPPSTSLFLLRFRMLENKP